MTTVADPRAEKAPWKRQPVKGGWRVADHHREEMDDIGEPSEVARLDTADLNSAKELYQRPLDKSVVRDLVETWDWDAFRTLLVNQRPDGTYWLVDGQHRVEAIKEKFGRDMVVWCSVVHLPGASEEAALYARVSGSHNKLSPAVLFLGRLTRREPVAVDIDRIVQEQGFALTLLGRAESEYQLAIPAVLDRIYKQHGPEGLREVLSFCRDCWAGQRGFASSHVVTGVAKFFEYFSDSKGWERGRIVEILSDIPLEEVIKEGKRVIGEFGDHRHAALAKAMQRLVNSKIRGKSNKLFREETRRPPSGKNGKS